MRRLAVLAVVAVLAGAGCGDGSTVDIGSPTTTTGPPTTTSRVPATTEAATTTTVAPTTTTVAQVAEIPDIQIARQAMAAWNTGNVDAYLDFFTEDATYIQWPAHADHVRDRFEFDMTLGSQLALGDCEQWADGRLRCPALARDDLSGPAGLMQDAVLTFWITDGLISKYSSAQYDHPDFYFTQAMAFWLEGAHPDVWESTFALSERCSINDEFNCWTSWYASAETATVLLEYVSEFVAQSDDYSFSQ